MSKTIQDPHLSLALWRYGIISPLLHRSSDDPALARKLAALADRAFQRPDGTTVQLSAETLRKWLYRYRRGGVAALAKHERSDKGHQQVPADLAEHLAALRREHPLWTLSKTLEKLLGKGVWNGNHPSRASLYRFARNHALKRESASQSPCRSFAFEHFGQLWVADFMHGPRLREGRCLKKAILHAIIDDATRFVVCAGFAWHETVETLLGELMLAVRRFGIPQRLYTDNGPCYASAHLKLVCGNLGIHLAHTPPYRPQGRGKVERLFRTVREQFLSECQARSLAQLNNELQSFLADYHQRIHGSLGISPLQKRLGTTSLCRELPEVADLWHMFAMQRKCRVYKDSTVHLQQRIFEVPGALAGSRVDLFYLPWDLNRVLYGTDRLTARPVDKAANARRFENPNTGKESPNDH